MITTIEQTSSTAKDITNKTMKYCIDCGYNEVAKGRRICNTCKQRRYVAKHPVEAAYQNLKGHAKSRGKEFTITLDQFREFCTKCDYINGKGRTKEGLHIDRIREWEGYHIDNIQTLPNSQNIRKYIAFTQLDEEGRATFKTFTNKQQIPDADDCPF